MIAFGLIGVVAIGICLLRKKGLMSGGTIRCILVRVLLSYSVLLWDVYLRCMLIAINASCIFIYVLLCSWLNGLLILFSKYMLI